MNKPIIITGIKAILPDPKTDMVRVGVNANGEDVTLHLHKGVLGGLIIGLMKASQAFKSDPNATEFLGQPFTLNNARPFVVDDKVHGLELTVEGSLKIPVVFPVNGIEVWRQVVKHLEAASKTRPKKPRTQ